LNAYPTDEVLGLLFGLDKGNARRNVLDILEALDTCDDFPFDRPDADPGRRPRRARCPPMQTVLSAIVHRWKRSYRR
jgi:hypothetical protein